MRHGHAVKEEEMNSKKEIISPKEMKVSRQIPRVTVKGIPQARRCTGLAHGREEAEDSQWVSSETTTPVC